MHLLKSFFSHFWHQVAQNIPLNLVDEMTHLSVVLIVPILVMFGLLWAHEAPIESVLPLGIPVDCRT